MKPTNFVIGYTGTQVGLTEPQYESTYNVLRTFMKPENAVIGIHGDCFGADVQFGKACKELNIYVMIRPGHDSFGNQPKTANSYSDVTHPPEPYLVRNKRIVNQCDLLIAGPQEFEMQLRSGTWSTVRYALKQKKHVCIVYPDGSVEWKDYDAPA